MTYDRQTYQLRRFELIAPHVRNDGSASYYPEALRAALSAAGFEGWTEIVSHGYWLGTYEHGTTFVLYSADVRIDVMGEALLSDADVCSCPDGSAEGITERECGCRVRRNTADMLAALARRAMPDQDAIQLVIGEPVELREA